MLGLTKKTDYALIALSYMAKRPQSVVSAREVAATTRVPLPILTNILKTLTNGGFVVSERGAYGGYGLAKPAESITLRDLITAIEGPIQFVQCVQPEEKSSRGPCGLQDNCPIRLPALRVHGRLGEFLDRLTLAELVEDLDEPMPAQTEEETKPASPIGDVVREQRK